MKDNTQYIEQLTAVAKCLGNDWTYDSSSVNYDHVGDIYHTTGAKIHITADKYGNKGKYCFGVSWPRSCSGGYHSGFDWGVLELDETLEINVSFTRSPESIAKDFLRRIGNKVIELWPTVLEKKAKQQQQLSANYQKAKVLAELTNNKLKSESECLRNDSHYNFSLYRFIPDGYGSVEMGNYSDASVSLKLSVNYDLAVKLLKFINQETNNVN